MIFNRIEAWRKNDEYTHKLLGEYKMLEMPQEKEAINSTFGLNHFMQEVAFEKQVQGEKITLTTVEDAIILYLFGKLEEELVEGEDYNLDTLLKMYEDKIRRLDTPIKVEETMNRFTFQFLYYLDYLQNSHGIIWLADNVDAPMFLPNQDNSELIGTLITKRGYSTIETIHFIKDEAEKLEQEKGRI